jgi:MYXO-CTERM domain-containing protein
MRSEAAVSPVPGPILSSLLGAILVLGTTSCSPVDPAAPPGGEDEQVSQASSSEPPTLPVVGGDSAPVCSFPMTAKIPGCTATLISPTILITAKHCGPKAGMAIQFGEKTPFEFTVMAVKCVTAKDSDAAYCVLPDDERLKKVPTVPVLAGCEYAKFMKVGARLTGVGFGQTMGTGPARTKNVVEVPVARVRDPFIDVGDKTHDLCFGDSGGGAYIHLVEGDKDWGWRVIGTVTGTARGVGAPCGGTDYTTVLRHIKLIEDTEKIDITPCTDATGAWAPGPGCQGFLTDPRTGGGVWPDCSSGPRTTLAIDSCGAGPAPIGPTPGSADAGAPPVSADASAPTPSKPDASAPGGGSSTGGTSGAEPGGTGGAPSGGTPTPTGGAPATPTGGASGTADAGAKTAGPSQPVTGGCQFSPTATGGTTAPLLGLVALFLVTRRRRRA